MEELEKMGSERKLTKSLPRRLTHFSLHFWHMTYAKHIATFDNSFQKKKVNQPEKKRVLYFLARQSFPDKAVIGRAYNSITLNEIAYISK